jgi:3-hydroxyacyl-CoA dehydrogenase
MHHTAAFGLGFDEVDALTGPKIGRPKSATFRTADVVGLDTWPTSSRPCRTRCRRPVARHFTRRRRG